jgi:hypothetical protein
VNYYFFSNFTLDNKKMKNSYILIVLFGFMMQQPLACGNSNSGSCTMEMSSKTNKKDCCQKDSHSKKAKHNDCNGKWKALCSAPSVNTAIPHYNQFEIKSSNFNFSSEKFYPVILPPLAYPKFQLKPIFDSH